MSPSLKRHSSAARIIMASLLVFALGLALLTVVILHLLERESRELVFAQQYSAVAQVSDRIDRTIREQIRVLEGIADQIVVGEELLPLEEIETVLENLIQLKKFFNGGLLLLDLEADILLDVPALVGRRGGSYANAHHFQRVFAQGRALIGPPLENPLMDQPLLPISTPVFAASGRPLGVLSGMVDLAAANFLYQEAGHAYAESGDYVIVDPDSGLFMVATADRQLVLQPVPLPGVNPLHDRYMAGFEGSGIVVSSGEKKIASARRVPVADWFVVARLPVAEAFAPLRNLQRRIILLALLVLLPIAGLIIWFIKRQLDPLVEYADTLDAMTAGRLPITPLPERGDDELGRLLKSFNHLLASIRAAEEKFRGIAETSPDLIFQISRDGRITYCSPAARAMLGLEPEEVAGADFRDFIESGDLGRAQQAFATALGGEGVRVWELTLRRGDKSSFVGEVYVAPILDRERVVGVQGVVRDVTTRRQAALALAQQLFFQKMVADISTLFVKAEERRIDSAIEEALQLSASFFAVDRAYLFLFSADQTTLNNSHEWCAPGITPCKERIQGVSLEKYPWIIRRICREPFVLLPDIEQLPAEAAVEREEFKVQEIKSMLLLPLQTTGRQLGFIGYDAVRHRKKWHDEEIVSLKLVAEIITNALVRHAMEEALHRKREELARSNAELTDFAHIASHDLQEPLRKVIAFGDRLQLKYGALLEGKGADYLARMQNAAERMQGLIDDLLQYSRVNSRGKEFERVNPMEVLAEVKESLEQPIGELGAKIKIEPLPQLLADRRQLHSLFQNLLGNALKYHRSGVIPEIKVQLLGSAGGLAEIVVSDNGIGFDEKYLDRIFRPFQRLHGRSEYQGSGIGLAICKKIVERHGGTIGASAIPGEGASFRVKLPLGTRTPAINSQQM